MTRTVRSRFKAIRATLAERGVALFEGTTEDVMVFQAWAAQHGYRVTVSAAADDLKAIPRRWTLRT